MWLWLACQAVDGVGVVSSTVKTAPAEELVEYTSILCSSGWASNSTLSPVPNPFTVAAQYTSSSSATLLSKSSPSTSKLFPLCPITVNKPWLSADMESDGNIGAVISNLVPTG